MSSHCGVSFYYKQRSNVHLDLLLNWFQKDMWYADFEQDTVADYRPSTVQLQIKNLLPCVLDLTPAIKVIYYWDYRKCFLKYSISLISIVDWLVYNKVFTCRFWGHFIQQWIFKVTLFFWKTLKLKSKHKKTEKLDLLEIDTMILITVFLESFESS